MENNLWRRSPKRFINFIAAVFIAAICLVSCDFFADGDNERSDPALSYFRISSTQASVKVGEMSYVYFSYSPSSADLNPKFDYDETYFSVSSVTNSGFVITGKKEGQSTLTVSAGGRACTCIVTVSGYSENYVDTSEPYIYSATSIVQLSSNSSERVHVSLYNGTVSDNLNYSWSIENPSVASISSNGQYCLIKGLSEGYSRIKVANSAATYPYYIGVYVIDDPTRTTYITSRDNIKTVYVNKGEEKISVDLENPKSDLYKSYFSWEILDGDKDCVSISANQNECLVAPLKGGECTIRVTNKEADNNIPFDILVRSIEIVDSAYIVPSPPDVVVIDGDSEQVVTSTIAGLTAEKDYSSSDFTYEIENDYYVETWSFGNQISIKGRHNGSTSLFIGHPSCQKKRQVLIVCENQKADAVDASCYITTTQDYIKTKVGAEETKVKVTLKGGNSGDERKFHWNIKQNPADGNSDVISVTTTNDNTYESGRAALGSVEGVLIIKPLSVGTATITVSNSKSYYPTEILVKVLDSYAVLESPLYFTGDGIVKFLNSETASYKVSLNGDSKSKTDESAVSWSTSSPTLDVIGNETVAELRSRAEGSAVHNMTVSHPKVESPKEVLVLTADTQEELDAIKAFYSNKTYYSVNVGKCVNIYTSSVGFYNESGEELDFSTVSGLSWSSSDPSVFTVEADGGEPLTGVVSGKKAGTATATVRYGDTAASFHVTVYPENVEIGAVETSVYFSTSQNVVVIPTVGASTVISVSAVGMKSSEYKNISWSSSDETKATVVGNGTSATVTAAGDGECVLYVRHPLSENELKIYIRIGEKYVTTSPAVKYISANTDTIVLKKDSSPYVLKAYLVNGNDADKTGFSFEIEDESIASLISGYTTGEAYIKPVGGGQTELVISHKSTAIKRHIPIIIGNTDEELAGIKYLTTSQPVITLIEGSTKKVSVDIENADDVVLSGYTWTSTDNSVAGIQASATSTAVIVGNAPGTAVVTCRNESAGCRYGVEIIVQVLDAAVVAKCPHISVAQPVIELTVSQSFTTVTAELIGGNDTDLIDFTWTSDDPSVIEAYGQNGVGKVRAVGPGITYLRVSHPKTPYDQLIMCICSEAVTTDCSISVSSGNIMSILPTASDQTITATLVNGTATDKYNFSWSLDVYDIVDMTYSANTAIITPLKEGIAQLTVHHPKSPYDQVVVIKVQQYSSFAFGDTSKTIVAGNTSYVSMQVPTANVNTTVEYSVDNPQIATVTGTNAVCAITGLQAGTCVIHAKMKAGTVTYAETKTDLLVNVTPAAEISSYISGTQTIYTMDIGDSKTFSASLIGTSSPATDIYSLEWTTGNPSVLKLAGAQKDSNGNYKATGASVYGTAIASGETTLTVHHPDVATDLVYHIIVSEEGEHTLSINKTYVTLDKGAKTELTAKIDNGTSDEYKNIVWSCDKVGGNEIVRLLASSGKTTAIYAVRPGTTYVYATTSNGQCEKCQVTVNESKTLSFGYSTVKVQPVAEYARDIEYTMFPTDATLNWKIMTSDGKEHFTVSNNGISDAANGKGSVRITGLSECASSVQVYFFNSYGSSATLNVMCGWDYDFTLLATPKIDGEPTGEYTIGYTVTPSGSVFEIPDTDCAVITEVITEKTIEQRKGYFKIVPRTDTTSAGEDVVITARNPVNNAIVGSKSINLKFGYKNIPVTLEILSSDGCWTEVNNVTNTIYLGDGETVNFKAILGGKNSVKSAVGKVDFNNSNLCKVLQDNQHLEKFTFSETEPVDYTEKQYRIEWAKIPVFYSNGNKNSYSGVKLLNFKNDLKWLHYENKYHSTSWGDQNWYNDHWGLVSEDYSTTNFDTYKTGHDVHDEKWLCGDSEDNDAHTSIASSKYWSLVENPDEKGKIYSVDEFKKIALYYIQPDQTDATDDSCWKWSGSTRQRGDQVNRHNEFAKSVSILETAEDGTEKATGIVSETVSAVLEPSTDTSYTEKELGNVIVDVKNAYTGAEVSVNYTVVLRTRKCLKTYSGK